MPDKTVQEAIQIEDRWYVLATSSRTGDPTRVLKHGETFALFDRYGDALHIGDGEHGIYHEGMRFLSHYELRLNGEHPILLNSTVKEDNSRLTVDLTTPDFHQSGKMAIMKGTVHVSRSRLLWDAACHERILVVNYAERAVSLVLSIDFGADYADIFEVRGFHRDRRGRDLSPAVYADRVVLGYRGLDDISRYTELGWSPGPTRLTPERAEYELHLEPRGQAVLETTITCEPQSTSRQARIDYSKALICTEASLFGARARAARFSTGNEHFNAWLNRSAADLVMLTNGNPQGPYPYAGVPWYNTPFGRDGLITAIEMLWVDPTMARGVLAFLARTQADAVRPEQDAEPGKIVHEMRKGELANLGEIPFGCYYGSIDSTPLFVILAGDYYRRTRDLSFAQQLWPHVARALAWIDNYGDLDGDGFVEYQRKSVDGLSQQGWKDSEDSVFHRNGELAPPPIALVEVQGYVYLARLRAAELIEALGDLERGLALRRQAEALRLNFERAFWCEEIGTYAMALDGNKQPCMVRSSNAGQALWSGIVSRERAPRVADTLLSAASFSGWGIRTIAEGEARYNPMSYHNGSIWPHDNALIAMGMARYGLKEKTAAIMRGLFEASLHMDLHRLPELFCGFPRRPAEGPTLYPVACSPQAWASASSFYLLEACLGLSFWPESPRIRLRHPVLPDFLPRVNITDLRIEEASIDMELERHDRDVGVNILGKHGNIDVSVLL